MGLIAIVAIFKKPNSNGERRNQLSANLSSAEWQYTQNLFQAIASLSPWNYRGGSECLELMTPTEASIHGASKSGCGA